MITIAPKSSIIARAVRKTFSERGTLFPSKESTPKEKAISVADGIAHPLRVTGSPKFMATYINAGTNIPPTAPMMGRTACLGFESSH